MTQEWADLTFLHFAVAPAEVQEKLPDGLSVDTFPDESGREMAWIGLVPFEIRQLSFSPRFRVPSATTFLETNVRTYVHRNGQNPGVWFFSLDAASQIACAAARIWFGLPYWLARMSMAKSGSDLSYSCRRSRGGRPSSRVGVSIGAPLKDPVAGELEFFLVERYVLYSSYRGKLKIGRVHHSPYPLREVRLSGLEDELVRAADFTLRPISSALYSPGVHVEIFPLSPSDR